MKLSCHRLIGRATHPICPQYDDRVLFCFSDLPLRLSRMYGSFERTHRDAEHVVDPYLMMHYVIAQQ